MYGYNHSFCSAERRSVGQKDFCDPEQPDYIYRRYICTDISIRSARQNAVLPSRTQFCPAERCSARQNAVLPGRTIFATLRCKLIYIGDIYIRR